MRNAFTYLHSYSHHVNVKGGREIEEKLKSRLVAD